MRRSPKDEARQRALDMVKAVKLPDPERMMSSYPHQLVGRPAATHRHRHGTAVEAALLLLDEPTTALDVTVEASIVDLVKELGRKFGTSMIFVSHNLGLIRETCDRITVMYSGEAVETGAIADVFSTMRHPYTQGLFRSIALPGTDKNRQSAGRHSRSAAAAARASARLQFRSALRLLHQGPLRCRRYCHGPGAGR